MNKIMNKINIFFLYDKNVRVIGSNTDAIQYYTDVIQVIPTFFVIVFIYHI